MRLGRYPRRDEGTTENAATTVEYLYDNGWNHRQYVKLRNPFGASPDAVYDSSRADLTYNTSGSPKSTALWHETSPGSFSYTKVFETQSPDDTSGMARPASWNVLGGPGGSNVATLPFAYDKSGNITSIGSDAYLYDSRSRLIQDSIVSRSAALNPERREYDGFGNIRRVTNGGNVATLAVNMGNNRLSESGMVWDEARGQLRYDTKDARNMWRDFYPDGRQLTDYYTLSGNVIDLLRGWSASLYDAAGERSLEYWSGGHECSDQVFRLPLRGDDAKVLTDYRGQFTSGECTYAVQWSKDYVWIGNRAQILLDRDSGTVRWRALNHLGTPRWAFDSAGNLTGQEQLDSWGGVIGTTLNERHKFTGHERDHALLANGYGADPNPMADYMHTRTYVPMLGRFTSPDSLSRFSLFPQRLNRYTYVYNTPVNLVDPFGMKGEEPDTRMPRIPADVEVIGGQDPIWIRFVLFSLEGNRRWNAQFRQRANALALQPHAVPTSAEEVWGVDEFSIMPPNAGELLYQGFAATVDGFVPFVDPLSATYTHDAASGISNTIGSVSFALVSLAASARLAASLGGTKLFHVMNHNRYLRIGPGRMPANGGLRAGPKVPRISLGPQRAGQRNPHRDLRLRPFDR